MSCRLGELWRGMELNRKGARLGRTWQEGRLGDLETSPAPSSLVSTPFIIVRNIDLIKAAFLSTTVLQELHPALHNDCETTQ